MNFLNEFFMNFFVPTYAGPPAYQSYLGVLEAQVHAAEREVTTLRAQVAEVNRMRKEEQTQAGRRARTLDDAWVAHVTKNYELELVCAQIEQRIKDAGGELPQGAGAEVPLDSGEREGGAWGGHRAIRDWDMASARDGHRGDGHGDTGHRGDGHGDAGHRDAEHGDSGQRGKREGDVANSESDYREEGGE